ncbi:sensor histidine kinase [Gracilimonas sp. BCB1]|uniref:sensor histidine kinase n=1 Tax=Gracilimonas sp. BCB1 TaxID=3152362 RepID=UPI0032D96555
MTHDLGFYKLLSKLKWPASYSGKILLIAFIGTHVPLIALFIFLTFFYPIEYRMVILMCVLVATLGGTAGTLYYIYKILGPVRLTGHALNKYRSEKEKPHLPTDYWDDAGVLMSQTQFCIEELDALLNFKNRLLSLISHDSRTPLSTINLASEMIEAEIKGDETNEDQVKHFLEMIKVSAQHQLEFMNSMLSLARFDEGKLTLDQKEVKAGELFEDLKKNHQLYLSTKNIDFETLSSLSENEILYLDKEKMMSVLNNLVQNAIKFTPEGGKISVSVSSDSENYILTVKDNGVGISEEQKKDIFEAFSSSSEGTGSEKGTGLGLWIARVFTELHDGTISLSGKEGEGTTITITIPKKGR